MLFTLLDKSMSLQLTSFIMSWTHDGITKSASVMKKKTFGLNPTWANPSVRQSLTVGRRVSQVTLV